MKTYEDFKHDLLRELILQGNMTDLTYKDEHLYLSSENVAIKQGVDEAYKIYSTGTDFDEIVGFYLNTIKKIPCLQTVREILSSPQQTKEHLIVKLMNINDIYDYALYKTIGDIAMVAYLHINSDDESQLFVRAAEGILEYFDNDKDALFELALKNTARLFPDRVINFFNVLFSLNSNTSVFTINYEPNLTQEGNILTNSIKQNGAVAIFYPGVAERFADLFNSGFYVAFTSKHEAMVHYEHSTNVHALKTTIKNMKRDGIIPEEDFLTESILYYDRLTREFLTL